METTTPDVYEPFRPDGVIYICSKCQSKNIEYFSYCNITKEGHRCLDCHHEKLSTKKEREQELLQHAMSIPFPY